MSLCTIVLFECVWIAVSCCTCKLEGARELEYGTRCAGRDGLIDVQLTNLERHTPDKQARAVLVGSMTQKRIRLELVALTVMAPVVLYLLLFDHAN